ncbi:signal recognition particle-docking protein FtsY [Candidatus Nucleicultrix amoebiphila]|jgi:fused signal recognition particle receptor|uniref:Signal recognition particle receptor FtsY n=1 Tax=Candidatus Nucleicultrix amoebiphila FS5 TaxID=1414854 RepID=A0A1W6N3T5_9PROT|nr:signal recognition particle-docking protein FtsY [Candidatus Nucleicultrix amoebiphila]ARN84436.1 cell division protein FtsY [Candidatus Nucleicultrix amoebiphila FS5]
MAEKKEEKKGWFKRLKEGLSKTSTKLSEGITNIIKKRKLDQNTLDELEELLILSDLGVDTSKNIIEALKKERFNQDISDEELKGFLAEKIEAILKPVEKPITLGKNKKPFVMLIVGVNGSGKTTTIGKLAHYFHNEGHKIRLAACDTFRAAAVEQLQVWAKRINVPIAVASQGADAAGLAFDTLQQSQKNKDDILIIDTAGRLHNKSDLMDELSKIRRVIQKIDETAPHSCLLVLDATVGQNAHMQTEIFLKTTQITGLIMTKLDGTARGGVLVSLAERFKLPVYAIGVGEDIDDLRPFEAKSFARALLGLDGEK